MTIVIKGLQKWEVIGLKASYRENVTALPEEHGRLIDADAPIVLTDAHGREIEVTVSHIIERNGGEIVSVIEAEG